MRNRTSRKIISLGFMLLVVTGVVAPSTSASNSSRHADAPPSCLVNPG